MLASDIMTSPVISVSPTTLVLDVATLLREKKIGGVPVLLEQRLVGIVTEADLLHRVEIGTEEMDESRPWWKKIGRRSRLAEDYVKSHGRTVDFVMSRNVVTLSPHLPLPQVASRLDQYRIGRAPVVEHERVVGIIARADLINALTHAKSASRSAFRHSDEAIRAQLRKELVDKSWWKDGWSSVHVSDGVVIFRGIVEDESERLAARVAAENIDGVTRVQDERILTPGYSAIM